MHDTALEYGRLLLAHYWEPGFTRCVELGSLEVNGGLRGLAPANAHWLGLDMQPGPGVDLVVAPDASLPLADAVADIALASSVLEHDDAFWETFGEMCRITRPGGILYFNVPSNGPVHRYPRDCWRFYPDAAPALAKWATRRGLPVQLLESFTAPRGADLWNDHVAVFRRGEAARPGGAPLSHARPAWNIWRHGAAGMTDRNDFTEDMMLLHHLRARVAELEARLAG
jgi:SAM-dependent methyltransferase